MNILFLPLLFNNFKINFIIGLFIIVHCLLSTLMFFIVDVVYKRFHTRSTSKLSGLIHILPNISICIFISIILFSGLPFTIKFFVEIYLYGVFLTYDVISLLSIIFFCNLIGLIGFCKIFFNILFGYPLNMYISYDLTKKELYLFLFIFLNLIVVLYLLVIIF